jgi:glutamyl/glutaminyl-tRNA synthetase
MARKRTPTQAGIMVPTECSIENFLFEGMKNGDFPEGSHVLRAKIDMKSTNMLMRDPLMYRITPSSSEQEISGIYIRCMIMHMAKVIIWSKFRIRYVP